ncbi:Hypothetical protein PBC10988_24640 [Planctomycetales bacterium 10988]|nr:Hypothetical protein PBC10988_24640 [Planctomycetales bacterium 10988]
MSQSSTVPDYLTLIESIQEILSGEGADPQNAAPKAAQFTQLCHQANARLEACQELLQQGYRSEALRRSDWDPPLIDLVASLDFAEFADWQDYTKAHELETPPDLNLEIAKELAEAFAMEAPIQDHLKRFREESLSGASLSKRLGTIFELEYLDPSQPFWKEDLAKFQSAWLEEVPEMINRMYEGRDLRGLKGLRTHLQQEDTWLVETPPDVAQRLERACNRLEKASSKNELAKILQKMKQAMAHDQVQEVYELRDQWGELIERVELPDDHPVHEEVAPVWEYLQEKEDQERRKEAFAIHVQQLENAIIARRPRKELVQIHRQLNLYGMKIPPETDNKYKREIERLKTIAFRNWILLGAFLIFVAVGIGMTAWRMIANERYKIELAKQRDQLASLVNQEKFDEGKAFLEQLEKDEPIMASDASFEPLVDKLAAEERRRASYLEKIEEAEEAGVRLPNDMALQEAARLARTTEERNRVRNWKTKVDAVQEEQESSRRSVLMQTINDLDRELSSLPEDNPEDRFVLRQKLTRLASNLESTLERNRPVPEDLKKRADELSADLRTRSQRLRLADERQEAISRVRRMVGEIPAYRNALEAVIKVQPESPTAEAIKDSLEEVPGLQAVLAWNSFLGVWSSDGAQLSPGQAEVRVKTTQSFLEENQRLPILDDLRTRLRDWQAISARGSGSSSATQALRRMWDNQFIGGPLWRVKTTSGSFYMESEPSILQSNDRFTVRFLSDQNGGTELERVQRDSVLQSGNAPQIGLVDSLKSVLSRLNDYARNPVAERQKRNWENIFADLLSTVLKAQEVDPILRVEMMQKIIEVGSRGSLPFAEAFEAHKDALTSSGLDRITNWVNPEEKEANEQRKIAQTVLENFPSIEDATKDAMSRLQRIGSSIGEPYLWTGWLHQEETGKWTVAFRDRPPRQGDLWVLVAPKTGPWRFQKVGSLDNREFSLASINPYAFQQGRPVFWTSED